MCVIGFKRKAKLQYFTQKAKIRYYFNNQNIAEPLD